MPFSPFTIHDSRLTIHHSRFKGLVLFTFICLLQLSALAQDDKFSGTWQMDFLPVAGDTAQVHVKLEIGSPEKNQLYPAQLSIRYQSFTGVYELLLVKKSYSQLAIGRNKVPVNEMPFSVGKWTIYLNGTFDLEKNKKGDFLKAVRIPSKNYGVKMPALSNYDDSVVTTAMRIQYTLREYDLSLMKVSNAPWTSTATDHILQPFHSGAYYGIMDTIHVKTNNGTLSFADNNKIDNDTVYAVLNGKTVIDRTDLRRKSPVEDIHLDTGQNILVFFADNYGKTPPNTGKLNVELGSEKFGINFANEADFSSTFIVAKLYYYPQVPPKVTPPELLRNTKLVDEMHTTSAEVTLAIWDDALEDGDSISLNINGAWIAQGFAVKKKPQFLKVTLQPGPNNIIFVADNLGAIPPNTSILEIIDGKKRKSFMINTDLGRNNLVRITYDFSP